MKEKLTSQRIMDTGWAFMSSKTLLTAVELGLFTRLGTHRMTANEIAQVLELHPERIYDFLDALVALKFLERAGDGHEGQYYNSAESAEFLDRSSDHYMGGILEMASRRLYRFWDDLPMALRTGAPQSEIKNGGRLLFEEIYQDQDKLEVFSSAMSGLSRENFAIFSQKFDLSNYQTHCDVGGSTALFSTTLAQRNPHLKCTSFDLPGLVPIATKHIQRQGLQDQVVAVGGDFLKDDLPKVDLITMGLILHDWGLPEKKMLVQKAYNSLNAGGALVIVENLIDDERRTNSFGLLMSLNMLIEFGPAFDYTFNDFQQWCEEVGFRRFEKIPLTASASAAVAYK